MIDPKLYSLIEVYETGSFSKAAKRLSITQPAVSQHIRALEEELGIKIFVRSDGKLHTTNMGKKAVVFGKKVIGMYHVLQQEISDSAAMTEHLMIGITHTAESNPIAQALADYCAEHDGVNIKMITDTIRNLYKRLQTYELDLIIAEGRPNSESLKYLMLDTDYLVLAVSPEHELAKRSLVTLNELKQERLILRLPTSGTTNLFVSHLESNNMDIGEFNVILEVDNVATIKDLVRRNFGVSILPKSVCLEEIAKKKLVVLPVENLSMVRDINIIYRGDFSQTDLLYGIVESYNTTLKKYK